ncbi:MAG TPA: hypothetical protein VGJ33_10825 [Candidatus Angelobacter sp.]|jgi:hypothetical protein
MAIHSIIHTCDFSLPDDETVVDGSLVNMLNEAYGKPYHHTTGKPI